MLPHWICQTWGVALGLLLLGGIRILQKEFSAAIFDISRGAKAVYHAHYRGLQVRRRGRCGGDAPPAGPAGFFQPGAPEIIWAVDAQFLQALAGLARQISRRGEGRVSPGGVPFLDGDVKRAGGSLRV